jgi:hypothetical protein
MRPKFWPNFLKLSDHLEDVGVHRNIKSERSLKKYDVRIVTGFN